MIESDFTVATRDGAMPTYLARPDYGTHPLVILYMDAYGIRQELRDMALRLACSGYAVAMPNLYYRLTPDELGPIPEPDEFERLDLLNRCVQSLTIPDVMADTSGLLTALAGQESVETARFATLGYCMSGRFAVAAAAKLPDRVVAAASIYGTWLISADPESPHLAAPKAKGDVYFACAEDDHWAPLEAVEELRLHLRHAGSPATVEIYYGASHAFAFPQRRHYNRLADARHWERLLRLFGEAFARSEPPGIVPQAAR